jgi:endonuclease/exonuclease/phosphatase family metal-dependent hydrolase
MLAGDLNSTPPGFPRSVSNPHGNNAMATLDDSGCFQRKPTLPTLTDSNLTYHSVGPRSVIDWILIPSHWRFLRYRVALSQLSDHRPVYADVAPGSAAARYGTD